MPCECLTGSLRLLQHRLAKPSGRSADEIAISALAACWGSRSPRAYSRAASARAAIVIAMISVTVTQGEQCRGKDVFAGTSVTIFLRFETRPWLVFLDQPTWRVFPKYWRKPLALCGQVLCLARYAVDASEGLQAVGGQ